MKRIRRKGKILEFRAVEEEVGSTSLIHNIAYELVRKDKQVLVIDMSLSGGLTSLFNHHSLAFDIDDPENVFKNSIPLKNRVPIFSQSDIVFRNIDLIPYKYDTYFIDEDKDNKDKLESSLKYFIEEKAHDYDYILIDSSKDLNFTKESLFQISHLLVIPINGFFNMWEESEEKNLLMEYMETLNNSRPNKLINIFFIPIYSYDENDETYPFYLSAPKYLSIEKIIGRMYPKLYEKYDIEILNAINYADAVVDAYCNQSFVYEYIKKNNLLSENKGYLSDITEITQKLIKKQI